MRVPGSGGEKMTLMAARTVSPDESWDNICSRTGATVVFALEAADDRLLFRNVAVAEERFRGLVYALTKRHLTDGETPRPSLPLGGATLLREVVVSERSADLDAFVAGHPLDDVAQAYLRQLTLALPAPHVTLVQVIDNSWERRIALFLRATPTTETDLVQLERTVRMAEWPRVPDVISRLATSYERDLKDVAATLRSPALHDDLASVYQAVSLAVGADRVVVLEANRHSAQVRVKAQWPEHDGPVQPLRPGEVIQTQQAAFADMMNGSIRIFPQLTDGRTIEDDEHVLAAGYRSALYLPLPDHTLGPCIVVALSRNPRQYDEATVSQLRMALLPATGVAEGPSPSRQPIDDRLQLAIDIGSGPIVVLDPESFQVRLLNNEADRYFGYGRNEMLGRSIVELVEGGVDLIDSVRRGRSHVEPVSLRTAGGRKPARLDFIQHRTGDSEVLLLMIRDLSKAYQRVEYFGALNAVADRAEAASGPAEAARAIVEALNELAGSYAIYEPADDGFAVAATNLPPGVDLRELPGLFPGASREAVYAELPASLTKLVDPAAARELGVIVAPVKIEDSVKAVVALVSSNLGELDRSAVQGFAARLALALRERATAAEAAALSVPAIDMPSEVASAVIDATDYQTLLTGALRALSHHAPFEVAVLRTCSAGRETIRIVSERPLGVDIIARLVEIS
ncbi:MAG TPA: PAS domain-containing protein, partial [Dehalococcoidia bacterium]|nr:PAS domain-containing protein [Dehalococcoidia bacterium]